MMIEYDVAAREDQYQTLIHFILNKCYIMSVLINLMNFQ